MALVEVGPQRAQERRGRGRQGVREGVGGRERAARGSRRGGGQAAAAGIVVPEAAGAVPDAVLAIEMAAHEDAEPGAGAPAGLFVKLQPDALEGDRKSTRLNSSHRH